MKAITVELTKLEAEKIHACIMSVAKDFAIQCYEKGIDINGTDYEAERYKFYLELAKKFR